MLSLFILILFGVGVAFFAGQNTQSTSVVVGPYGLQNVPLYGVILGAMLFGIFVSWLISLVGFVSTSMTLRGKEGRIKDAQDRIHKLEEQNHDLEIENTRLREEGQVVEHRTIDAPDEERSANPFVKLRQRFS
jgi:uncharacterized integral membrane protein